MIKISETDDVIDICRDNVFKAVFTKDTPESKDVLSKLLSAVIGRKVTVDGIIANEPSVENLRERQIRVEVFATVSFASSGPKAYRLWNCPLI